MESAGHECATARDGDSAWEAFLAQSPQVVLVADDLPPTQDGPDGAPARDSSPGEGYGLALCRRIRAHASSGRAYVLVLASRPDEDELAGLRAGADDCLTKPVDAAAIHSRLMVAHRVTALHAELSRYRSALSDRVRTDPLTALSTRLRLSEDLSVLLDRGQRYGERFAVALCSVDGYEDYRVRTGEAAGDRAVQAVARTLTETVRRSDLVYRFGGAEFAVVLPQQAWAGALAAMERVRRSVQALGIEDSASPDSVLTLSVGISVFSPARPISAEDLVAEADQAHSRARSGGTNSVVLAEPDQKVAANEW
ncbi:Wsp signal transduction system regulator diguanylate cyclase WspR [Sinomonas halotolerans]